MSIEGKIVAVGSLTDMVASQCDVRFTPTCGHVQRKVKCPLWANSGHADQATFFAAGGFHVPLMMKGDLSFGQYMRNIRINLSFGAGSQLLSLSAPGD
jgi:hypothetical protein